MQLSSHEHRTWAGRVIKYTSSRATEAKAQIEVDLKQPGAISRWAFLVICLGAMAAVTWTLLLSLLALHLLIDLWGWIVALGPSLP